MANCPRQKLADVASRIPPEWQISPSRLPPPTAANVLSLPRTSGVLTAKEIHITEDYDARELLNTLKHRKFTAVEVTTAFCKVGYPTSTRCSLTYLPPNFNYLLTGGIGSEQASRTA